MKSSLCRYHQHYKSYYTNQQQQCNVVVPAIISEHKGNAEQINMDILSRWVQWKGIADRTWRGLLGVLRIHYPHIKSIMYVPLHSIIVMAVYLQHRQLPKILTQLYMALIALPIP